MTGGLDKFKSFIKRNLVASILGSAIIYIFFNMLMDALNDWIPEQFGFRNVIMAGLALIIILFVAIFVLYYREDKIKKDIIAEPTFEPLQERYKGLIVSISLVREPKEQIMEAIDKIRDEYLFSWDDIPGKDSEKLLSFLKVECDVSWSENAEINKSTDGKIILITVGENSVKIVIDKEGGKGFIHLSDGYIYNLEVKVEMGKLKLYVIDKGLYKIYQVRGIGQTFRAIKHHCGALEKCWMLCSGDVKESEELVKHFTKKFSKKTVQVEPIPLIELNNIEEIYKKVDHIYREMIKKNRLDETDVIADLTGGTVIMSCAMIFACLSPQRDMEYVEQKTYNLIKIEENVSEIVFKR